MIEFLKVAAPLMVLVSFVLVFAGGIAPSLRGSKAYCFLYSEFMFVTTIALGGLAVLTTNSFAFVGTGLWFIVSSFGFARAIFLTTK